MHAENGNERNPSAVRSDWTVRRILPRGWALLITHLIADFDEIEEIRLGLLESRGGTEFAGRRHMPSRGGGRARRTRLLFLGVYLNTYCPAYRLRMLGLILQRLFNVQVGFAIQPLTTKIRTVSGRAYPMTRFMVRLQENGGLLYRRKSEIVDHGQTPAGWSPPGIG